MENIIRGTTPSLILDFADITEFTVDDIDELTLTISRRTVTEKHGLNDMVRDGDKLIYHFTQEQTFAFTAREKIYFQCDVLVGTEVYRVLDGRSEVEDTKRTEVMGNG